MEYWWDLCSFNQTSINSWWNIDKICVFSIKNLSIPDGLLMRFVYFQLKIYQFLMEYWWDVCIFNQKIHQFLMEYWWDLCNFNQKSINSWRNIDEICVISIKNISILDGILIRCVYFQSKSINYWWNTDETCVFSIKNLSIIDGILMRFVYFQSKIYQFLMEYWWDLCLFNQKSINSWRNIDEICVISIKNLSILDGILMRFVYFQLKIY